MSGTAWTWLSAHGGALPDDTVQMSRDNRYVAYIVGASSVGRGVDEAVRQDLRTGRRIVVSVSSTGAPADSDVSHLSMSDDGRFVAFETAANNLVSGDTNGAVDVFVRDVRQRRTVRVSVDGRGRQLSGGGIFPTISGGGGTVLFESTANVTGLPETPYGAESLPHLYTYSLQSGRVQVVSRSASGLGDVDGPAVVSGDGRYVAFASRSRLSAAATSNADVYLADRRTGGLALLTGHLDTPTTGLYQALSMDESAHWLVFAAADQADPHPNWYVDDLHSGRITAVDGSPATALAPVSDARVATRAPDVVYRGGGGGLSEDPLGTTSGPTRASWTVRDLRTGAVREVVADSDPTQALGCFSRSPADAAPTLSPDATRLVVLTGRPLVSADKNCAYDLYLARTGVGR